MTFSCHSCQKLIDNDNDRCSLIVDGGTVFLHRLCFWSNEARKATDLLMGLDPDDEDYLLATELVKSTVKVVERLAQRRREELANAPTETDSGSPHSPVDWPPDEQPGQPLSASSSTAYGIVDPAAAHRIWTRPPPKAPPPYQSR